MSLRSHPILTGLIGLILLAPLSGLTAPPPGRLLAAQCAQCHGTDGQAVGDIDRLSGESAREIYSEMIEMKYSNDPGDIMHRQAKGYTDTQIQLIADYYASVSGTTTGTGGEADDDESPTKSQPPSKKASNRDDED